MKYLKPPSKPASFNTVILDAIDYAYTYLELVEALVKHEDFKLFWINMTHHDKYLHKIRDN